MNSPKLPALWIVSSIVLLAFLNRMKMDALCNYCLSVLEALLRVMGLKPQSTPSCDVKTVSEALKISLMDPATSGKAAQVLHNILVVDARRKMHLLTGLSKAPECAQSFRSTRCSYSSANVEVTGDPLEAACDAGMFVI